MAKYLVSKKGMKKGYWKITKNGITVHSGIQSKRASESIAKNLNKHKK